MNSMLLIQSDVAMESHPPTPAGSMHKAESTTMLCEDSGGTACGTANTSSSSEANLSSGEVSFSPLQPNIMSLPTVKIGYEMIQDCKGDRQ